MHFFILYIHDLELVLITKEFADYTKMGSGMILPVCSEKWQMKIKCTVNVDICKVKNFRNNKKKYINTECLKKRFQRSEKGSNLAFTISSLMI